MINLDIFDSLQDGVLVLSEDTQIQYCNEAAALLTGLPVRRILRNKVTLGDIIYFDKKPTWMDALGTVKDSTTYQELSFSNVMGEHGRIQISVQPIASDPNDGPRWLVYLRDVRLEEVLQKKYRDELEQKEGFIAELQRAQTKLINYSKNLESMVQERTHEIKDLNVQMKALLDSLSQGFLIFNESGDCLSIFSQACLTTLERSPLHQKIWDVLSLSPAETISFKKWLVALFGHLLPFEDLKPLGPLTYKHTKGRSISLDFFPLMNSTSFVNDKLNGVVMVATDITELVEAQRQFESEKNSAQLILALVKKQAEIGRFITEAQKLLANVQQVASSGQWTEHQEALLRWIHTLKGGSGSFTIPELGNHCHQAENLIVQLRSKSPPSTESLDKAISHIQVSIDDFIIDARQILGPRAFSSESYISVKVSDLRHWANQFSMWSKGLATSDTIYRNYLYTPVENLLTPYQELLQKLSDSQQKQILPLKIQTNNVAVAEEIYSSLFASLVHIFRNLIDHGIEFPEERTLSQKPAEGKIEVTVALKTVALKAITQSELLVIDISDDGRGINPEKIRSKMTSLGVDTSTENDEQVIQHVFDAQVSTKETVTELSGRGVGLDAVKVEVTRLGGRIWVTSQLGQGTTFRIEVPWKAQIHKASLQAA